MDEERKETLLRVIIVCIHGSRILNSWELNSPQRHLKKMVELQNTLRGTNHEQISSGGGGAVGHASGFSIR